MRLAEALYSGAELARWLEKIIASLAAACVRLQLQENQATPGGSHTDAAGLLSLFSASTGTFCVTNSLTFMFRCEAARCGEAGFVGEPAAWRDTWISIVQQ